MEIAPEGDIGSFHIGRIIGRPRGVAPEGGASHRQHAQQAAPGSHQLSPPPARDQLVCCKGPRPGKVRGVPGFPFTPHPRQLSAVPPAPPFPHRPPRIPMTFLQIPWSAPHLHSVFPNPRGFLSASSACAHVSIGVDVGKICGWWGGEISPGELSLVTAPDFIVTLKSISPKPSDVCALNLAEPERVVNEKVNPNNGRTRNGWQMRRRINAKNGITKTSSSPCLSPFL